MHEVNEHKNIVELQGIGFSYGENRVLHDITLSIPRGEYLGVVGPNGAGKTTLLKIILGLLKPSEGSVTLFGTDISQFKEWARIGYVPQKATSFDEKFPATVYEVTLMGRYGRRGMFHMTTAEDKRKVKKILEQVGMLEFKDRLIGDLSGGQQQRVFIARALAGDPEIIFLDEPTVGIDQKTRDEFYALLAKLNKEHHLTLVLISHDIEMVTREVKHVACIDRNLVCYSLPEEFLEDTRTGMVRGGDIKVVAHGHKH